jgi:23S rRNA (uracil1939-C5)-methyltransferase
MKIEFQIEHIDPIGQGVSKGAEASDKITFIKKTLPNESGTAEVFSEKKGVRFARLLELKSPSPDRQVPDCPHFQECNGCDFLHTNYQKELEFKKNALSRHLFKFPKVEIGVHSAPKRLNYRNRIQLHYHKKQKKLGMLNSHHEIVAVNECKIINPSIAFELRSLYENNSWLNLVTKEPNEGHIELYSKENLKGHNVQIAVNKPYAHGGFTQVNPQMNDILCQWVQEKANQIIPPKAVVYDLFGGNGNLSSKFKNTTIVIDKYRQIPANMGHQKFYSIDLYDKNAIKSLINLKLEGAPRPQWIVFDPPRSGLKNISDFLNEFKPEGFIFIACEPTSFARDLIGVLNQYDLVSIDLFDLFPSTIHFETVGVFTSRKNT